LARGSCRWLAFNTLFWLSWSCDDSPVSANDRLRTALYPRGAPAFGLSPRQNLLEASSRRGGDGCFSGGSAGESFRRVEGRFRFACLRSRAVCAWRTIVWWDSGIKEQVFSLWLGIATRNSR